MEYEPERINPRVREDFEQRGDVTRNFEWMTAEEIINKFGDNLSEDELDKLKNKKTK